MSLTFTAAAQDTTVVELARDGLAVVSAWTMVGLGLAFLAILVVLVLVLAELRTLSRAWTGFVATTTERSGPLVEHANNAARNLDHITSVVRSEIDRLKGMVEGVTDDVGEASVEVRRRIADLSALLDLAQSEAEDAVLDAAAKLRMLRKGAGLLAGVAGLGGGVGMVVVMTGKRVEVWRGRVMREMMPGWRRRWRPWVRRIGSSRQDVAAVREIRISATEVATSRSPPDSGSVPTPRPRIRPPRSGYSTGS